MFVAERLPAKVHATRAPLKPIQLNLPVKGFIAAIGPVLVALTNTDPLLSPWNSRKPLIVAKGWRIQLSVIMLVPTRNLPRPRTLKIGLIETVPGADTFTAAPGTNG